MTYAARLGPDWQSIAAPSAGELTSAELRRALALAAVPAADDLVARSLALSAH